MRKRIELRRIDLRTRNLESRLREPAGFEASSADSIFVLRLARRQLLRRARLPENRVHADPVEGGQPKLARGLFAAQPAEDSIRSEKSPTFLGGIAAIGRSA
jgi:hypothetical protein